MFVRLQLLDEAGAGLFARFADAELLATLALKGSPGEGAISAPSSTSRGHGAKKTSLWGKDRRRLPERACGLSRRSSSHTRDEAYAELHAKNAKPSADD